MYYYRVCFPEDTNPKWEDLPLPGGNNSLIGFWTPHYSCAVKIYQARVDYAAFEYGSGTYSRIYKIEKNKVEKKEILKEKKSGHKDEFDRGEVYVSGLNEIPEDITEKVIQKEKIY